MNYQQAMEYIEARKGLGYSMGLGHIRLLCEKLGNPQEQLAFIHVAGTNGKGSVSAFLTSVLTANGYRVGTFSSPAVFCYEETMRFQGKPIAKAMLAKMVEKVSHAVAEMEEEGEIPSMFEVETAVAFCFFVEKKCELVVLEAGLGGLEDATNVIQNTVLAVLTSISMDHMEYLGDTHYQIAQNKAAIIKKGACVVTIEQSEEVLQAIHEACEQVGTVCRIANRKQVSQVKYGMTKQSFSYGSYRKMEIGLLGAYQIDNAVLALEAIEALKDAGYAMKTEKIYEGMADARWPGRFTIVDKKPYFVIDGAHNPDAAKRLSETISLHFGNKRIIYIMGVLKDKACDEIIRQTCAQAVHIITVATPNKARTMPAYELASKVSEYHNSVTAADSIEEAVEMAYLLADKDDVIIAFGSLSYLGKLTEVLKKRNKHQIDAHGQREK